MFGLMFRFWVLGSNLCSDLRRAFGAESALGGEHTGWRVAGDISR